MTPAIAALVLMFAAYAIVRLARNDTQVTWLRAAAAFALLGALLVPVAGGAQALLRNAGAHVVSPLPGLTDLADAALLECRRGKNTRHLLTGLLRQSVFGRLAGYEDVNDAERLAHDPAMRAVVDRSGLDRQAASTSSDA